MKRPSRLTPKVRYVYVIGPERGLQKIGMATDPQSRLATLQTASPLDLMIHAAIAVPFLVAPDVESQAHRLLGRMCVRNEWFDITPAEALFAVYTAALPWMERRSKRIHAEASIPSDLMRHHRIMPNSTEIPGRQPGISMASDDALPLFRSQDLPTL